MKLDNDTLRRKPLYAVPFSTVEDSDEPIQPVVAAPWGTEDGVTVPHGLDREIAAALPGLWYCLHLPNDFLQLVSVPASTLKLSQNLYLDHRILLVPIQLLEEQHVSDWLPSSLPVLVVCSDDLHEEAVQRSGTLGFALPPIGFSQLSDESLRAHWRAIHKHFLRGEVYLDREPKLSKRLDLSATSLPMRWVLRQLGNRAGASSSDSLDPGELFDDALWHQLVVAAIAGLEQEGVSAEIAEQRMPQAIEEEVTRMRVPVALALPGVAPAYARLAYEPTLRKRIEVLEQTDDQDTWSVEIHERSDTLIERSAIEFLVAHQAIARSGVGLMLSSVPGAAFGQLAEIERHFSGRPRATAVWRMLERLDLIAASLWNASLSSAASRAGVLIAFTNFPIGLLRRPGDSSPLLTRVPIAYRPLLPLTRAIQMELALVPSVELAGGISVLVAECIPDDGSVGRMSRAGWRFAEETVRSSGQPVRMDIVETQTVEALRSAVRELSPDILVISAHGMLQPTGNVAGLVVGHEAVLGGLGPLPPVVVLSACHVAPRGAGTVSIADMLLREGAVAVLGTQVPVDVRHNAILMSRFFVYITEVLAGRENHPTILDVWHRVQTSNALNDILNGSDSLRAWGRSMMPGGRTVIEEFMAHRSTGQLRAGRIYEDTERVLAEMADDQGIGERIRGWFRSPGYVPESLFYVFIGRPESIYLQPRLSPSQR